MTASQIKTQLKQKIDKLSAKKLKDVAAYVDSVAAPQEPEGTRYKPEFIEKIRRAERQIAAGKTITWDELKRKHGL